MLICFVGVVWLCGCVGVVCGCSGRSPALPDEPKIAPALVNAQLLRCMQAVCLLGLIGGTPGDRLPSFSECNLHEEKRYGSVGMFLDSSRASYLQWSSRLTYLDSNYNQTSTPIISNRYSLKIRVYLYRYLARTVLVTSRANSPELLSSCTDLCRAKASCQVWISARHPRLVLFWKDLLSPPPYDHHLIDHRDTDSMG